MRVTSPCTVPYIPTVAESMQKPSNDSYRNTSTGGGSKAIIAYLHVTYKEVSSEYKRLNVPHLVADMFFGLLSSAN